MKEFDINSEEDMDMLVEAVTGYEVYSQRELKMKASILKNIESSLMYLNFSD